VVGAKVRGIEKDWVMNNDGSKQDFSLQVSISYSQILPKEFESKDLVSFSAIKGTLFYLFNIKGGALSSLVWSTITLSATCALLLF